MPPVLDPALPRRGLGARPAAASRRGLPGAWRATDFALASASVEQVDEAREYAAAVLRPAPAGRRGGHRPDAPDPRRLRVRPHGDHGDLDGGRDPDARGPACARTSPTSRSPACAATASRPATSAATSSTAPPPGRPRVVGADASHAWVAVWLPDPSGATGGDWLAFDPTNDQWAEDRYVTVAWGRDYADVPPVKGVIFTEAKKSTLQVSVDVSPLAVA